MVDRYDAVAAEDCPLWIARPGEEIGEDVLANNTYGLVVGNAADSAQIVEGTPVALLAVTARAHRLVLDLLAGLPHPSGPPPGSDHVSDLVAILPWVGAPQDRDGQPNAAYVDGCEHPAVAAALSYLASYGHWLPGDDTGTTITDLMVHLLTDLRHLCDVVALDWQQIIERAARRYTEQSTGYPDPAPSTPDSR